MRQDRRRPAPPAMRQRDEPPPNRWERVTVSLEFGGFTVLAVSGMIACAWSTVRYFAGWSRSVQAPDRHSGLH